MERARWEKGDMNRMKIVSKLRDRLKLLAKNGTPAWVMVSG
jgi:hypothetical protein